jgi:hypothetical protein
MASGPRRNHQFPARRTEAGWLGGRRHGGAAGRLPRALAWSGPPLDVRPASASGGRGASPCGPYFACRAVFDTHRRRSARPSRGALAGGTSRAEVSRRSPCEARWATRQTPGRSGDRATVGGIRLRHPGPSSGGRPTRRWLSGAEEDAMASANLGNLANLDFHPRKPQTGLQGRHDFSKERARRRQIRKARCIRTGLRN